MDVSDVLTAIIRAMTYRPYDGGSQLLKRPSAYKRLHGVVFQKIVILLVAVRNRRLTSDLA
jgi:hypothetical protein